MGADDEQKIRGSKRAILYCNEANELEYKKGVLSVAYAYNRPYIYRL